MFIMALYASKLAWQMLCYWLMRDFCYFVSDARLKYRSAWHEKRSCTENATEFERNT